MAKAIAKTCSATFINVHQSTIQSKWFGESQKLIRALFSLARKLAPTIIFIDEIDGFLRERSSGDHEVSTSLKTEFMCLIDGLVSHSDKPIIVLGATNRPFDLDDAVLRRLPRQFLFNLPSLADRAAILEVLLAGIPLDSSVTFPSLAALCTDYSGSDLKELCKVAAMRPVRELIKKSGLSEGKIQEANVNDFLTGSGAGAPTARPLNIQDFTESLKQILPTGRESMKFQQMFAEGQKKKKMNQ
jgi:SpoVK/Ycf46/Vps4 family AAA+-type ATPase